MHNSITIIIPTLNEKYHLPHVLDDLAKQSVQPDEIIIVDGKSTDGTIAVINRKKKMKIFESKANVAVQRNIGAKHAQSDLLFFLDADVRCPKDFIKNCLSEFNNKNLAIACPKYLPYNSTRIITGIYSLFNYLFKLGEKRFPSGAGSCIIIEKSLFKAGKGFLRKYTYEDIEMIRRYAKQSQFGLLDEVIYVSDRRFRQEGTMKLFMKYMHLSYFFLTNQFMKANRVDYPYNHKNAY